MSEFLSTKEAAEWLGVSESTLNHWRVAGCGPAFVKLGRRVMYRRDEDLGTFVTKNVRQSTTEAVV
jgi:hypothetical protein